jgi:hypothetical protein
VAFQGREYVVNDTLEIGSLTVRGSYLLNSFKSPADLGPLSDLLQQFEVAAAQVPGGAQAAGTAAALAPVKAAFYQKVSGRDLTQVKATWARLVFTGRGRPPKELRDAAAVKKEVASDPRAIAYIYKSDVDSSVKVVLTLQ